MTNERLVGFSQKPTKYISFSRDELIYLDRVTDSCAWRASAENNTGVAAAESRRIETR